MSIIKNSEYQDATRGAIRPFTINFNPSPIIDIKIYTLLLFMFIECWHTPSYPTYKRFNVAFSKWMSTELISLTLSANFLSVTKKKLKVYFIL
jgi:hypothetical protein